MGQIDLNIEKSFDGFFRKATKDKKSPSGYDPYPFQKRFATSEELPELIDIPTGMGKTDAVILGWLWRRRFDPREEIRNQTPRRLIYCLPMRVLVEQTKDKARKWLNNLEILLDHPGNGEGIAVTLLMGGEDKDDWDLYPERDAIIIGTQDMLLSRVLNRGYGMSRYRWPVHFGLLNNDCLWVMDEVQLMGVGVETLAQIQAFSRSLGTLKDVRHIWMSATIGEKQLETVDHPRPPLGWSKHSLDASDKSIQAVMKKLEAPKILKKAELRLDKDNEKKMYPAEMAKLIQNKHKCGTLTLVVVNRVERAQKIFLELLKIGRTENDTAVLHSRFRESDREKRMALLDENQDRIVVSTQVVEAGVDISAHTLITELAPWPSLVQRFGRCNRRGNHEDAIVEWIDLDTNEDGLSLPYDRASLDTARALAENIKNACPKNLSAIHYEEPLKVRPILRKRDLLDLFDTTPDLTGNDLDVSIYIRDGDDNDIQVYWREMDESGPRGQLDDERREELCSVSIVQINRYLKEAPGWIWDPLVSEWRVIHNCRPGQTILLDPKKGGYDSNLGWLGIAGKETVSVIPAEESDGKKSKSMNSDPGSLAGRWVSLQEHTEDVVMNVKTLAEDIDLSAEFETILVSAAQWHDVGKLHEAFQNMLLSSIPEGDSLPPGGPWAKSRRLNNQRKPSRFDYWVGPINGKKIWRPYFRHELASALAWLQTEGRERNDSDSVAYLAAAHHGKVRMSIRSLSQEKEPPEQMKLFARGIWDGDRLSHAEGILQSDILLDLSIMQIGKGSWLERMLSLRDHPEFGPFRLAFLESLLRIADWRASRMEEDETVIR